jgi:hypothetical protein
MGVPAAGGHLRHDRVPCKPVPIGGKFRGRQPESLRIDELQEITNFLQTGERKDWSLN